MPLDTICNKKCNFLAIFSAFRHDLLVERCFSISILVPLGTTCKAFYSHAVPKGTEKTPYKSPFYQQIVPKGTKGTTDFRPWIGYFFPYPYPQ